MKVVLVRQLLENDQGGHELHLLLEVELSKVGLLLKQILDEENLLLNQLLPELSSLGEGGVGEEVTVASELVQELANPGFELLDSGRVRQGEHYTNIADLVSEISALLLREEGAARSQDSR